MSHVAHQFQQFIAGYSTVGGGDTSSVHANLHLFLHAAKANITGGKCAGLRRNSTTKNIKGIAQTHNFKAQVKITTHCRSLRVPQTKLRPKRLKIVWHVQLISRPTSRPIAQMPRTWHREPTRVTSPSLFWCAWSLVSLPTFS